MRRILWNTQRVSRLLRCHVPAAVFEHTASAWHRLILILTQTKQQFEPLSSEPEAQTEEMSRLVCRTQVSHRRLLADKYPCGFQCFTKQFEHLPTWGLSSCFVKTRVTFSRGLWHLSCREDTGHSKANRHSVDALFSMCHVPPCLVPYAKACAAERPTSHLDKPAEHSYRNVTAYLLLRSHEPVCRRVIIAPIQCSEERLGLGRGSHGCWGGTGRPCQASLHMVPVADRTAGSHADKPS